MKSGMIATVAAAAVLLGFSSADPRIVFRGDPSESGFGSVILSGLSADAIRDLNPDGKRWGRLFPVYVGSIPADEDEKPSILGRYTIEEGMVRFTPRLPFVPGLSYSARFHGKPSRGIPDLELTFTMPAPEGTGPTRVVAVHPSADEVPANLLRLYVHFSAPMLPKNVHRHIHLRDRDTGTEVPLAFVDVPSGLWDPGNRRLTLFVHPGRVKRGVAPGERMGPVLVEGRRYRLVIDAGMMDAGGRSLGETYEKDFTAMGPDRTSPDPSLWKLTPPATRGGAVILDIPAPLDHALLGRLISVREESGGIIAGNVSISRDETRWEMEPREDWAAGRYTILIHPAIEDLAGNTVNRTFEEDGLLAPSPTAEGRPIEIPFAVAPEAR